MKNKHIAFILVSLFTFVIFTSQANAQSNELVGNGEVTVTPSDNSVIVDPEDPEEILDPDVNISTKGNLRFDHLPNIDFGSVEMTEKNRSYHALAEKIKKNSRGSFIQISDLREKSTGWVVQVKQDYQFKTEDGDELSGAVLSVDKGWANSTSSSEAPTITRNILSVTNIGEAYEVARASKGQGKGVWSISFGSSGENDDGQKNTLTKTRDIKNTAITLKIPDGTKIAAKEYQTKFTWSITAAP